LNTITLESMLGRDTYVSSVDFNWFTIGKYVP